MHGNSFNTETDQSEQRLKEHESGAFQRFRFLIVSLREFQRFFFGNPKENLKCQYLDKENFAPICPHSPLPLRGITSHR